MVKRAETYFRDHVVKERATVQVRHGKDGKPVAEHQACNCTLARIRAAMRNRKTIDN